MSFLICGVVMLLAHPYSRPRMAYAFEADEVTTVLRRNPLSHEPLEFFPPDASEMDGQKRYLAAFRIVRRLRSEFVKPDERDLGIVRRFIENAGELEPDNSYWLQLMAAVHGYTGDDAAGAVAWHEAAGRSRWDTGEGEAVRLLWNDVAEADGERLAWQGVVALDNASQGPSSFVAQYVKDFAYSNLGSRFDSLTNASTVLDSARSFSTSSAALSVAHMAVFGTTDPIGEMGQRGYEEAKAEFASLVGETMGAGAGERARRDIQNVESWQTFYRSGDPIARAALVRIRIESLLCATLPSALFMASLVLVGVGLFGTLVAAGLGPVLNPDRRILFGLGVLVAGLLWWNTGVFLLAVWALTIAGVFCIPQMTARDEKLDWKRSEQFAVLCVAMLGMTLLAGSFVLGSTPAKLLGGRMEGGLYGAVAGLTLSLALPSAVVWARLRKVSVLRAAGETLRLLGFGGAIIGLTATLVLTPLALWRDAANRTLLEQWIRSEPATFRPDAPQ